MTTELRKPALALAGLFAFAAFGCENEPPPGTARQSVEISALPTVVSRAAAKELPNVKFEDAWKNVDRETKALHSYEVRGRDKNGKVREVKVSTTGEVLDSE